MNIRTTVLVGMNASFSHTALSVYALARTRPNTRLIVRECTINEDLHRVFRGILEEAPDCVAFSCYIWNISRILELARRIRAVRPEITLLFGGPEVSFDCRAWMETHPEIDAIFSGEGETGFADFFEKPPAELQGLWYRQEGRILAPTGPAPAADLSTFSPVYEGFAFAPHKIYYYEASRGCPYHCAFCLSSEEKLRQVPLTQVFTELQTLLAARVMLVKFVDRTMNADPDRFEAILQFIAENDNDVTGFHMEIHPAALTRRQIAQVAGLRKGLVQFEIGVQSTHPETCRAISRAGETSAIRESVARLRATDNVHLHLDLIAGLPYEDLTAFAQSFRDVLSMRPHKLQLGFLKLLRGTRLRRQAQAYGIRFAPDAPYEVLSTRWLTAEDLFLLQDIAAWLDAVYNDGHWNKTLLYLTHLAGEDAWQLFCELAESGTPPAAGRMAERLYAAGIRLDGAPGALSDLLLYDALNHSRRPPDSEVYRPDDWTAADFLQPGIEAALRDGVHGDLRPWFRKTRAQRFSHRVHAYQGGGPPDRGKEYLLFIYKEETSIRPIGKGS